LTPLALAVWIMDDGTHSGSGIRIATNSFSYEDQVFLVEKLQSLYQLKATVNKCGKNKKSIQQYNIYIHKESMAKLKILVFPFVEETMHRKFKAN
jgi:hypothetical protein